MKQSNYRLCVINGREVEANMLLDYQRIYQHWYGVWSQTFNEVTGEKMFFSDNFTRQDEIVALMDGDKCIAAVCHRLIDMRSGAFQKDSYFEAWPEEAYLKLGKYGDKAVIASHISVAPAYRRTTTGLRTSELAAYLSLIHLSQLPISGITGSSRNTRGMDSLFEMFQPEKLIEEVIYHGESTTLYSFYPRTMGFSAISAPVRQMGDQLWQEARMSEYLHPIFKTNVQGVNNVKAA